MSEKKKQSPEEIDGRPEEEVAYWREVDSLRKFLDELTGGLLQKKYHLSSFKFSAVSDNKMSAGGLITSKVTGECRLVINFIDPEKEAAYGEWLAEEQ